MYEITASLLSHKGEEIHSTREGVPDRQMAMERIAALLTDSGLFPEASSVSVRVALPENHFIEDFFGHPCPVECAAHPVDWAGILVD